MNSLGDAEQYTTKRFFMMGVAITVGRLDGGEITWAK